MKNGQTHIIQRQILEVEIPGGSEHWHWQERLSRFAREVFAPHLEALLDRHSTPGEVIRIEKLELTADLLTIENWEKLLLDDLLRKVEQALPTRPDDGKQPGAFEGQVRRETTAENLLEQFFFFLKNGTLPWQTPTSVRQNFEPVMLKVFEENRTPRRVEEFREMLRSQRVRQRLAAQFSGRFLVKLVSVFFKEKIAQVAENQDFLSEMSKRAGIPAEEIEPVFWTLFFEDASGIRETSMPGVANAEQTLLQKVWLRFLTKNPERAAAVVQAFFQQKKVEGTTGRMWPPPLQKLFEALQASPAKAESLVVWLKSQTGSFEKLVALHAGELETLMAKLSDLPPTGLKKWLDAKAGKAALPPTKQEQLTEKEQALEPVETEGIYVDNAGLVLLHPFLPTFFEELNVVKNGRMTNPHRAVHLLQYLATGQSATPEYELPLNKLLCGLPLEEPLTRKLRLTQKEKTEAEKLLEAVIRHWSVLMNTSPEGLQGTYLCREGKLSRRGHEDWQLQVEQKGFDILLNDLPWSISMIKLPWMGGMLWVEWQ